MPLTPIEDASLIAAALCAGVARWEPLSIGPKNYGEVCCDGLRHSTELDIVGVPILTQALRVTLRRLLMEASTATH